jgi:Domain of unknown function (DUF4926)
MEKASLQVFDSVALLRAIPEKNVAFGQVGTIVEQLEKGVFEVEFTDKFGQTIAEFAVQADDLNGVALRTGA